LQTAQEKQTAPELQTVQEKIEKEPEKSAAPEKQITQVITTKEPELPAAPELQTTQVITTKKPETHEHDLSSPDAPQDVTIINHAV